ncbi:MAG: long-chain fatty acid--CoA ligase [Halobacteriales archaeon]
MDWREAEAEYDDAVLGKMPLPRMFADSADRNRHEVAQRYKGGIYDRTLAPDVVPAAEPGEWGSLTYAEVHDIVKRLAAGFRELGVADGERVGIFAETRMEWAQSDFAVLAAGGVVTTVYTSSSPRQVEYLLGDSGAMGVVVENGELFDRVLEVEDALDLEFVVLVDETDHEAMDRPDVYTLAEVHAMGDETYDEDEYETWLDERDPDDLASLIYTSGTTGRPKGVELTHWNFKSNVDQVRRRYGPRPDKGDLPVIGPGSTTVSFLPLAHVFERLSGHFHMFAAGATVAYAESADTLQADFAAVRPTTGTSVPRVYEKIFAAIREQASESALKERIFEWAIEVGRAYATADDPGAGLSLKRAVADRLVFSTVREALGGRLELLISGGGSLSADLIELYHGMGLPVLEGYGLTETAPVVTVNPFEAPKIGTIGPPVYGEETALDGSVVDDEEFEDAPGAVGELLVRGPNVARGYWNKPEQTERAFIDELPASAVQVVDRQPAGGDDRGPWFRTGDIVAQDADGYITFLERVKEVIVLSTGKNVAPTPIEDAFSEVEIVEQVMVVGDGEKFVGALVVPNFEAVRTWADRNDVDLPDDPAAICADDRVHDRIAEAVDAVNEDFESHETIKQFRLVPEEFTEDNDLLTPSLKKKRRNILDRYETQVEAIYAEA